jgi:hypothetical protein
MTHSMQPYSIWVRLLLAVLAILATTTVLSGQSSRPISPVTGSQIQALLVVQ